MSYLKRVYKFFRNKVSRLHRFYLVYIRKVEWKDIEFFNVSWKKRIGTMVSLIPATAKSVLDVGCGRMWLREFLSKDVTYYGLDYTSRSDDTIVCDLNAREFPDIKTDVVFCSGVIEYIHEENLRWFFGKIRETAPIFVASYCIRDYNSSIRKRKMAFWHNHMYRSEIVEMIEASGFALESEDRVWAMRYSCSRRESERMLPML